MDRIIREDARLIILRELHQQADGRLNSDLLRTVLESYGLARTRDWVHEEMRWLADLALIRLHEIGTVRVAELLSKGRDHVERRLVIEGVKRPSPPEA